jgi:hypothetical protein
VTSKQFKGQLESLIPTKYDLIKNKDKVFNTLPNENLNLNYIIGMKTSQNGEELRKLLKITSTGKLVYPSGSTMVIMDKQSKNQQFFMKHKEEIVCTAMHPKGNIVASGTQAY